MGFAGPYFPRFSGFRGGRGSWGDKCVLPLIARIHLSPARAVAVAGSLSAAHRSFSLRHVCALVLGTHFPPGASQVWSPADAGLARLLVLRHVPGQRPLVTAQAVSLAQLFQASHAHTLLSPRGALSSLSAWRVRDRRHFRHVQRVRAGLVETLWCSARFVSSGLVRS